MNGEDGQAALRERVEELFYEEENPYMKGNVDFLLSKHPDAIREILDACRELEGVSDWLLERVARSGEENGIAMIPDPYVPGKLVSPEGMKKGKLGAPDPFSDISGYEEFLNREKNRTGYEGIPEEKRGKALKMQMEYMDADHCYRTARILGREMMLKEAVFFQNEESGSNGPLIRTMHTFDMAAMKMRVGFEARAAKLKYSKEFTGEKAERALGLMKKKLKEFFKEEE